MKVSDGTTIKVNSRIALSHRLGLKTARPCTQIEKEKDD